MHPQAIEQLTLPFTEWLEKRPSSPLRFLDLASGTETPLISEGLMNICERLGVSVEYTGIDLHESLAAAHFDFPPHVIQQRLLVADAYDMGFLKEKGEKFSCLLSGLNLHHLSPEEIVCAVREYKEILEPGGIFIIYDEIRPEEFAYIPKPAQQRMISEERLKEIIPLSLPSASSGVDWREVYFAAFQKYAASKGLTDEALLRASKEHICGNDFSMSSEELVALLQKEGFIVETRKFSDLYPAIPVAPFFGLFIAHLP